LALVKCLLHILDDFCEELLRWPEDAQHPASAGLQETHEKLRSLTESLDQVLYRHLSTFLPRTPGEEEFSLTEDECARVMEELEAISQDWECGAPT
jgi:hypothetical protein